ncbi:protein kinase [Perkinsela sp. CCAP 1560/4]|nr:protein kinase [Perkinsela sp. CCAP 1560/4]|eukprot:KNH01746.1 protein kinase [Perkinsela sp. CCAP 1560/4]
MLRSALCDGFPVILRQLHKDFRVFHLHASSRDRLAAPAKTSNQFFLTFGQSSSLYTRAIRDVPSATNRVIITVEEQLTLLAAPDTARTDDCERIQLDINAPLAREAFERQMENFIPNHRERDSCTFTRGTEQHNILGPVDCVHNVIVDMRESPAHEASPGAESLRCSLQSRKCLNLAKSWWGPTTVVLCALWDGPDARELLNHCRYRFRRVFYLVQNTSPASKSSQLVLLNRASKGSSRDLSAFEGEEFLGAPSFLIAQFPDDALLDVIDRRATRKHPTGREETHILPIHRRKWLHQGCKLSSRTRPASFLSSRPAFGDRDGGADRARLRHETNDRFNNLSHSVTNMIRRHGGKIGKERK